MEEDAATSEDDILILDEDAVISDEDTAISEFADVREFETGDCLGEVCDTSNEMRNTTKSDYNFDVNLAILKPVQLATLTITIGSEECDGLVDTGALFSLIKQNVADTYLLNI